MDFKDLEILRKGNAELKKELENAKKERDKACKDYLILYAKIENIKDLVRDLIKKQKYQINIDNFTYISLQQLGDLKMILDKLENKNEK